MLCSSNRRWKVTIKLDRKSYLLLMIKSSKVFPNRLVSISSGRSAGHLLYIPKLQQRYLDSRGVTLVRLKSALPQILDMFVQCVTMCGKRMKISAEQVGANHFIFDSWVSEIVLSIMKVWMLSKQNMFLGSICLP